MRPRFDHTASTTCGYCGVGCRLEAHARDGRVVSISPAADGPANAATPASRAASPISSAAHGSGSPRH